MSEGERIAVIDGVDGETDASQTPSQLRGRRE